MTLPCFEILDLLRRIDIGCAPDEHGAPQAVLISLRAEMAPDAFFAGDLLQPPYDYGDLIAAVDAAIAARPHVILQETLAVSIAARVLANPLVQALQLQLGKTERYAGTRAIGLSARFDRALLARLAPRYPDDPALAAFAAQASGA